ncbi:TonB-dependent receptor plug domain-containing protein [Sphingomonas sp.]|jgi:outer membrane receptor protein involved in Fe transport|uniref:TonB-dependent receptor plug domain-containing protein n=1 Tax=Sphingomonas sp. TaxID=28214 RepID=UPI002DF66F70|nr:TonB-dependent receptor [Sphingomonas sp.]
MQLAIRRRLLASTVLIGASMLGSAAYAQTETAADATATDETIVVTGSLITNPNLESSSPVAVVGSEEILLRQTPTAEALIRQLPGATPNIGSSVNNGNGGAALVDLRGLGPQRNLVLLDGNRVAPSTTTGSVDLNNIPLALIERTDLLTGGASTSYGADAITGVVNFITKRNFSGFEATAQQSITEKGDGNVFRIEVTMGANFDDGRGNAVISMGYQEADPVYQGARDFGRNGINSQTGIAAGGSPTSVPSSIAFNNGQFLQISPDGNSLVTPYQDFNFNPYNIFQTPFERYNLFGAANYEIADGVEVYGRGMFSRNTVQTIIAPSGVFGEELTVPANNPFLTPGVRAQICAAEGIAAADCTATSTTPLPLPGLYRRTVELGPRISTFVTTYFDFRGGIRLNVTESIRADLSVSHGESENTQTQSGYVLRSRIQQALNANNPNTCTNTANGCVPVNLFGPAGSISQSAAGFLLGTSATSNRASLSQARALINGDFGAAAPWAEDPISFAVGGEYRKYQASRVADFLAQNPSELGGAGGATLPFAGEYDVYEAFGELVAPIVQNKPFFEDLTVEAGIRYSHYTITGTNSTPKFNTTTWKAGASWTPVPSIKFRGNYQRAVRSPNIFELFRPQSTNLTNLNIDPCASLNLSGQRRSTGPTGILRDVCIAQGATEGNINNIIDPAAGQAQGTFTGSQALRPEKADTFTIGAVLQPEFLPGFSATIDYYELVVNDAISALTPDDAIAACFGNLTATSATSDACTSIRRNPVSGRLSGSAATTPGLRLPLTNAGRYFTNGVDVSLNYRADLAFAKLNLSFIGNWTKSQKFRASPTSALNRECVGYYSVNCTASQASIQPEFTWNQRTTLSFDNVDLSLLWRHISAVRYEPGLPQLFRGTVTGNTVFAGEQENFNFIKAADYFDLSARVGVGDNLDLTFTALNLFDRQPPLVGGNAGGTAFNSGNTFPSTYDTLGRSYSVTARLRF